jgi:hypothetical protein
MATLDELLIENYQHYFNMDDGKGAECKRLVEEFVINTPSVKDRDIEFVIILLKAVEQIIPKGHLDNYLDRIHKYHIESIQNITEKAQGNSSDHDMMMQSHLLYHSGNVLRRNCLKTRDPELAAQAFYELYASALIAQELLINIASDAYCRAACMAEVRYNLGPEYIWAINWFTAAYLAAEDTKTKFPNVSALQTNFAGHAAVKAGRFTYNSSWYKIAIRCFNTFLEYTQANPQKDYPNLVRVAKRSIGYCRIQIRELNNRIQE